MGSLSDTSSRYHLVLAVKKLLHSMFETLTWFMSMVVSHTRLHIFLNTQPHAPFDAVFDNYAFSVRGCGIAFFTRGFVRGASSHKRRESHCVYRGKVNRRCQAQRVDLGSSV